MPWASSPFHSVSQRALVPRSRRPSSWRSRWSGPVAPRRRAIRPARPPSSRPRASPARPRTWPSWWPPRPGWRSTTTAASGSSPRSPSAAPPPTACWCCSTGCPSTRPSAARSTSPRSRAAGSTGSRCCAARRGPSTAPARSAGWSTSSPGGPPPASGRPRRPAAPSRPARSPPTGRWRCWAARCCWPPAATPRRATSLTSTTRPPPSPATRSTRGCARTPPPPGPGRWPGSRCRSSVAGSTPCCRPRPETGACPASPATRRPTTGSVTGGCWLAVHYFRTTSAGLTLGGRLSGRLDRLEVRVGDPTPYDQRGVALGGAAELGVDHPGGRLSAQLSTELESIESQGLATTSRWSTGLAVGDDLLLLGARLRLAPALRLDAVGPFTGLSGKLGATWRLGPAWSLRASAGSTFRAPSLAELSYQQGLVMPNPGLTPESGLAADASLVADGPARPGDARAARHPLPGPDPLPADLDGPPEAVQRGAGLRGRPGGRAGHRPHARAGARHALRRLHLALHRAAPGGAGRGGEPDPLPGAPPALRPGQLVARAVRAPRRGPLRRVSATATGATSSRSRPRWPGMPAPRSTSPGRSG